MATRSRRAAGTSKGKSGGKPKAKAPPQRKPVAPKAPPSGPLTLEEATAIVQAARPQLAAKSAARKVAPPTSLAAVGAERKELKKKKQDEIARRTQEYRDVMRLMKKRGARAGVLRKAAGGGAVAKPGGFVPLQILAEGDSWFDYPVPLFGGGIIPRLQARLGVPILNLASAGDEARYMMGVEQTRKLVRHLKAGCPAGGSWDLVLFSGGGNDIVGDQMALWINDWDPSKPAAQHLVDSRFDAALAMVRAAYENLIALRDKFSPTTHILFHAYDYALPNGRGICHLGPWLKPTFDLRNFPSQAAAQVIVNSMIDQFASALAGLAKGRNVTFIRTPGTLAPLPSSWHNELHPSKDGFNRFAQLFHEQIRQLFPNRVA
jgi:hypothetical protein